MRKYHKAIATSFIHFFSQINKELYEKVQPAIDGGHIHHLGHKRSQHGGLYWQEYFYLFFLKILVIIVRYYGWVGIYMCELYRLLCPSRLYEIRLSAMTVTSVCCFFKECFCLDCLRVAEMHRQHNQPSQPSSMQLTRKSAKIIKNGGQQYQLTSQLKSKMAADEISWFSQILTWKIISVVLPDLFSLCNQSI